MPHVDIDDVMAARRVIDRYLPRAPLERSPLCNAAPPLLARIIGERAARALAAAR